MDDYENVTVDDTSVSDNGVTGSTVSPVSSELLCFVTDKCRIITFDDLVKVCHDFYSTEEIESARSIVAMHHKMPKRKGPEKFRTILQDILKVVLNPDVQLPVFYAVDLARLPPTDMKHCDMSAVLAELQALRCEVREMKHLQNEVSQLQAEVANMRAQLPCGASKATYLNELDEFPPLSAANPVAAPTAAAGRGSFALKATELRASGPKSLPRKAQPKSLTGSSTTNTVVSSAITTRQIEVFVSRLHPHSKTAEVEDCARCIIGDKLEVVEMHCEKLKARYEHLYMSCHLQVRVKSADMKCALGLLMRSESWPQGLFVKRFFKRKDDGPEQQ